MSCTYAASLSHEVPHPDTLPPPHERSIAPSPTTSKPERTPRKPCHLAHRRYPSDREREPLVPNEFPPAAPRTSHSSVTDPTPASQPPSPGAAPPARDTSGMLAQDTAPEKVGRTIGIDAAGDAARTTTRPQHEEDGAALGSGGCRLMEPNDRMVPPRQAMVLLRFRGCRVRIPRIVLCIRTARPSHRQRPHSRCGMKRSTGSPPSGMAATVWAGSCEGQQKDAPLPCRLPHVGKGAERLCVAVVFPPTSYSALLS